MGTARSGVGSVDQLVVVPTARIQPQGPPDQGISTGQRGELHHHVRRMGRHSKGGAPSTARLNRTTGTDGSRSSESHRAPICTSPTLRHTCHPTSRPTGRYIGPPRIRPGGRYTCRPTCQPGARYIRPPTCQPGGATPSGIRMPASWVA